MAPQDVSTASMIPKDTIINQKWILKQRPEGLFNPHTDVELATEQIIPTDHCAHDELILETTYLSVDAFIRTMLDEDAYHGSISLSSTMPALGYGRVIHAGSSTKMKAGTLVTGMMGAQTHCKIKANQVFRLMKFPFMAQTASLGLMGLTTGFTAYTGIFHVCARPKRGETVVVTAAAGAVGSIAAQLAKSTGARVIGVAGGKKKQAFLMEDLGLDGAIDYKDVNASLEHQLDQWCPDGIDFIYDNVGGEMLDLLMGRINSHGRVVICGAISQYGKKRGTALGPSNYIKLAEKGAMMKGFNVMQYMWKLPFTMMGMFYLYMRGKVKMIEHVEDGIASYPLALHKMFTGGHVGKLLVKMGTSSSVSSKDD